MTIFSKFYDIFSLETCCMFVPWQFAPDGVADTLLDAPCELVVNVRIARIFGSVQTFTANQLQRKAKILFSDFLQRYDPLNAWHCYGVECKTEKVWLMEEYRVCQIGVQLKYNSLSQRVDA